MKPRIGLVLVVAFLVSVEAVFGQAPSCPPPDSAAGMGAVLGRVVETQSQVPLGFVQLRLRTLGVEAPQEEISNTSGGFGFCSVPAGAFTLTGQLGPMGGMVGPEILEPGQTLTLHLEVAEATTKLELRRPAPEPAAEGATGAG